jgi:hypothetical protein
MNELYSTLRKEDNFLNHLFGENKDDYLNIFYLINRLINNIEEDTIIVTPNKRELAYITSIYSSLNFFYKNYEEQHNNFEQWLKPGQYVSLVSSGEHTGTVYKYLGRDRDNIKLESVAKKNKNTNYSIIKITQKIDTILQFSPTSNTSNKGNVKSIAAIPKNLTIPKIDKFLDIKSFRNPILYDNKIILLNNSVKRFENFYTKETLNKKDINYKINELISFGSIDIDGNVHGSDHVHLEKKIEPNIIATSSTDNLYNFLNKNLKEKIIICSNIRKISSPGNFIQYQQIKNENPKNKFLIFADENDFNDIEYLKKGNLSMNVFKLFQKDNKNFYNSDNKIKLPHSINEITKDIQSSVDKKIIPLKIKNNIFNEIDQIFLNIRNNLIFENENSKEIIKDLISPLNNLRFSLQDHIFGFPDDIIDNFSNTINIYSKDFSTKKSFLSEKIIDNLSKLLQVFNSIPKRNSTIFDDRLNEFKLILDENAIDHTVVYAYDIKRKNYFEKNIKEKFNLQHKAIASKNSKERFKNLIIPSEIITRFMMELINNNNYTKLFFIGGNNLPEKVNDIENQLLNKWELIIIDEIKKCEILNLDSIFQKDLKNPNFLNIEKSYNKEIKIEDFLYDDYSNINLDNDKDEGKTTPAIPIAFNGDAVGYLTENFTTNLLNPILDPTAYSKKNISKKSKDLEPGDIIMLRDSTDRDILDRESEYIYKGNLTYNELKKKAGGLKKIITESFGENININKFKEILLKFNYIKDIQTIRNIASGNTMCPNINDLIKILKACSFNCPDYLFSKDEASNIYYHATQYKILRGKAGRSIKPKIFDALKKMDIDFDGKPLRVDYNSDGSINLGSNITDEPEAWIVEVFNNYKVFKEKKNNLLNKVIF